MKSMWRHQIRVVLGISGLLSILTCEGYGASLTIGDTVSANGNMNATSFSGDGSGLTNVGGNSCTPITSLPSTITVSGVYCLKSDLSTAITQGSAIAIQADDVIIELNGYKLNGVAGAGIYAFRQKNITIRNGSVRGFTKGIWLSDTIGVGTISQSHLIENIRAELNMDIAIQIDGLNNIIRNSLVVNTTGTGSTNAIGIAANGPGARVLNNDVIETMHPTTGYGAGISITYASGAVVENNRIGNSSLGTYTNGIEVLSSTDVLVSNNRVTMMNHGIFYGASTGKYRDNLTSGVLIPFYVDAGAVIDAGNNN
jgi:nitrous oxidase accessory protein NosD